MEKSFTIKFEPAGDNEIKKKTLDALEGFGLNNFTDLLGNCYTKIKGKNVWLISWNNIQMDVLYFTPDILNGNILRVPGGMYVDKKTGQPKKPDDSIIMTIF